MGRTRWLFMICACFVVAVVVGRDVLQSPDGFSYAVAVRDGHGLVHPHHVLYGPLVSFVLTVLGSVISGVDAIRAAQFVNLLAALAFFGAAWRLLACRIRGTTWLVLSVAVLGAARALSVYTARVEVYLPLLAATAWLTVVTAGRDHPEDEPSGDRLLTAAFLLGLAALCHQLGALLAVPLLLVPWARFRNRLLVAIGGGIIAICGSYVAYLGAGIAEMPGFPSWLMSYALAPVEAWGTAGNWSLEGLRALALGHVKMFVPVPEALSSWVAITAWVLLFLVVGVNLRAHRDRILRRYAAVALITQLIFVMWWLPGDSDFALIGLWPLWILGWSAARDVLSAFGAHDRRFALTGLALMILVLTGVAQLGTMRNLDRQRIEAEARLQTLEFMIPDGAVIVTDYGTQQLLRWYGRPRVVLETSVMSGVSPTTLDDEVLNALATSEVVMIDASSARIAVGMQGVIRDLVLGLRRGANGGLESAKLWTPCANSNESTGAWFLVGPGWIEGEDESVVLQGIGSVSLIR